MYPFIKQDIFFDVITVLFFLYIYRVFVGINPEKGTKSSHPRDSGGIQGKVATFFDEYQRYMTFEKGEYDDTYMTSSVFNA